MSQAKDTETPVLRTENLTKVYADGAVNALSGVNLSIGTGQYVAIMGPSGSGKSTLLHLLGALDVPTSGEVFYRGHPLTLAESLDSLRSREFGFVFQSFYLLPNFTAVENVQLPMFEMPWTAKQRRDRADRLLEIVGMTHRSNQLPTRLSVGERQRVAIARALANEPAVLMGDEPTGNLDSRTGGEILDLFDKLHREQGMTIVIVTHEVEVARRADRLVRVRDGKIESDELTPSADTPTVSQPESRREVP